MAADEAGRFRRELVEHTGDRRVADTITKQDLLRKGLNAVGRAGPLGDSIRCDNTVTHVPRAIGSSTR